MNQPVLYAQRSENFYDNQTDAHAVGRFRAWYHSSRYQRIRELIRQHYNADNRVVDVACGGSVWNQERLPVIGVDVNAGMLRVGVARGRIAHGAISDADSISLKDGIADLLVFTEVLEHMPTPARTLRELRRVLKRDGRLILTVPFDVPFSPFALLFNTHCLIQGYVFGDEYYRQRCGHINHFSTQSLRSLVEPQGFVVEQLFVQNLFLIYLVARAV